MQKYRIRLGLAFWAVTILLLSAPAFARSGPLANYVIQCNQSCAGVAAAVGQIAGARINQQFANVAGLAVTLPVSSVAGIQARTDVAGVSKDVRVHAPVPVEAQAVPAASDVQVWSAGQITSQTGVLPADYNFNNNLIGASTLHGQGILGAGVVVAIIDSGTANNPAVVPALAGSVIGGETIVAGDPVTSATSTLNGQHGTWVGTVIAGHVAFLFSNASTLVQSLQAHAPDSVIPCSLLGCPPTLSAVPMIGVAPAASLYALKVFPSNSNSTDESTVIAGMDRAITLRRNFNNGVPSAPTNPGCGAENNPCVFNSLPIQVVNMSLGGPTLFAGHNLEDQLTLQMLQVGITVVVAAGNDGPAALTVSSPATGFGALVAAAASTAPHERILRDLQFGLGVGSLFRPFDGIQTATFSSRGPSADGRISVGVSSNGFATFAQGANGGLSLVSGTSFATPTTAGAAALLRQKFPAASATQIRNALTSGANPSGLADGSGRVDRGDGFLDIPGAAAKLAAGHVSSTLPVGLGSLSVPLNLLLLGIFPVNFSHDTFTAHFNNLLPGQVAQFYVPTQDSTDSLSISIQGVTPALPPAQQNQFFGDDVFLTVVDAPTAQADTLVADFVTADSTFTISQPQSGLVRVAVQGDSTNAGAVSGTLVIQRHVVDQGLPTAVGLVKQGQDNIVKLKVPAGTAQLSFLLSWLHDWGAYPTNDIDLVLEDPNGNVILDGATLNSPERVTVANPTAGVWLAHVQGFQINSAGPIFSSDLWSLRAKADGHRLSPLH